MHGCCSKDILIKDYVLFNYQQVIKCNIVPLDTNANSKDENMSKVEFCVTYSSLIFLVCILAW